ncbi:MAG: type II secretion system protein [Fimbriimonas ginsengisoli]|uniref:Type II secretion system protein n=1 Tax=Fimbriimonas ginsengisoli TaxID=1005039 RepID=A0A931PTK2_FIMGI|nr:type II secretion system protein [Fimbriimonas ginsengisoli]
MPKGRGFTLGELLSATVILAILAMVSAPMVKSARSAMSRRAASEALMTLNTALLLYTQESNERFPLAMASDEDGGVVTWFGRQDKGGKIDLDGGFLSSYLGKRHPKDPTADGDDYFGDHSGFGYNWEALGSDVCITHEFDFPDCQNSAWNAELHHPSSTIAFATSILILPPWEKGSGFYDFGFVSPPHEWHGIPNVDFRHGGLRRCDPATRTVTGPGRALVVMVDGTMKSLERSAVTDKLFERGQPDPTQM